MKKSASRPTAPAQNSRAPLSFSLVAAFAIALTVYLLPARADHDDPPAEALPPNPSASDLALRAFELVEHQVRAATTQENTGWASQPGAIRTFAEDGDLSRIYKLYSAPDLLAGSAAEAINDLASDWDQHPTRFVDLNEPVEADGELTFPIADPRVTPEGFSYEASINGVVPQDGNPDEQRLPMPVQWIYLLQDGTRGYLDSQNRFIGSVLATSENPIVGRIAFWADDNTAKVNINTASEGVHWDMPRTNTIEDRGLADSQPVEHEYQRHPGHPATVCLSSVLFPNQRIGTPRGGAGVMDPLPLADANLLWEIGNGIGRGGSMAGTVRLTSVSPTTAFPSDYTEYETITGFFDRPGNGNRPELEQRVARSKFFLTTKSNASELNLLHHARISSWPVDSSFAQQQPDYSGIVSAGLDIYAVSRGSESSRHAEYYNAHRGNNRIITDYLKSQTVRRLPGFGTSLADKYGGETFSDRDQILAMIFDHVRCVNLTEPRAPNSSPFAFTQNGQVSSLCICGGTSVHQTRWHRPEFPDPYAGGRIFTASEVALVFYCSGWLDNDGNSQGNTAGLSRGEKRIAAGLAVELFCPGHGLAYMVPAISARLAGEISGSTITQPPAMTLAGQPLGNASGALLLPENEPQSKGTPGGTGGTEVLLRDESGRGISWDTGVVVPIDAPTLSFGGNDEELQLLLFDVDLPTRANVNNSVQAFKLRFPDTEIPSPEIPAEIRSWESRLQSVRGSSDELIQATDTVRSLAVGHGDYRLVAGTRCTLESVFQPHFNYHDQTERHAHSLLRSDGIAAEGASFERELLPGSNVPAELLPDIPFSPSNENFAPRLADGYPFSIDPAVTGDFDNGFGETRDGPYLNRSDDGVLLTGSGITHYFGSRSESLSFDGGRLVQAPHRIMPGPVMFGSIPSGVRAGVPWRTLLFRPDPQHFGASSTPDHLWLDLFRMQAPLPYRNGASQPRSNDWKGDLFSTDGRININYQILPFSHIHRATAVHAAFKAEKMMAIPSEAGAEYKTRGGSASYRHFIDIEETLQQWEEKYARGDVFRSASQLCEMYLVPEGQVLGAKSDGDYPAMRAFWAAHKLTGDNTKERPYAALYQHFTTRSNTYDIHVIAQKLSKSETGPADVFDPALDTVTDEYRGSGTLTRRIDRDPRLVPFAQSLASFYNYGLSGVSPSLGGPFEISRIRLSSTGRPIITWTSSPGDSYVVQRSTDATHWDDIATVPSQGESSSFSDTAVPVGASRLFYRVTN